MLCRYQLPHAEPFVWKCECKYQKLFSSLNYNQLLKQSRSLETKHCHIFELHGLCICPSWYQTSIFRKVSLNPRAGLTSGAGRVLSCMVALNQQWDRRTVSGAGGIPALAHCLACLLSMTSSTMCWCKHELNCCTNIGTKCFKLWLFIWQNPQIQGRDIYCLAMVPQCKFLISHCQDSWCSHPLKADSTSSPYCSCTTKGEGACTCGLTSQCQGKGRRM